MKLNPNFYPIRMKLGFGAEYDFYRQLAAIGG